MRSLAELLLTHNVPGVRLSEIRSISAKAASDLTSCTVLPRHIRYTEGKLFFSVPSVVKSELILRQEELKRRLEAAGVRVIEIN